MKLLKQLSFLLIFSIGPIQMNFAQDNCFTWYDKSDMAGLPAAEVQFIGEEVFIGTFSGSLYILRDGEIDSIAVFQDDLLGKIIWDFSPYQDKLAILRGYGTQLEVYLLNLENYNIEKIIDSQEVIANCSIDDLDYCPQFPEVIETYEDQLLIASAAGLLIYDQNGLEQILDLNGDGFGDWVYDMEIVEDKAWLATNSGLMTYDLNNNQVIPELSTYGISLAALALNSEEEVFMISHDERFLIYQNEQLNEIVTNPEEIPLRIVKDMEFGFENKIWFTDLFGVYAYDGQEFYKLSNLFQGQTIDVEDDRLVAGSLDEVFISTCNNLMTSSLKPDPSRSIKLSPNPGQNTLDVSFENEAFIEKIKRIKIIDSSGREQTIPCETLGNKFILEISSLKGGVYFVLIQTRNGDYLKKFMKI